jgi:hypothetical protein
MIVIASRKFHLFIFSSFFSIVIMLTQSYGRLQYRRSVKNDRFCIEPLALYRSGDYDCGGAALAKPGQEKRHGKMTPYGVLILMKECIDEEKNKNCGRRGCCSVVGGNSGVCPGTRRFRRRA